MVIVGIYVVRKRKTHRGNAQGKLGDASESATHLGHTMPAKNADNRTSSTSHALGTASKGLLLALAGIVSISIGIAVITTAAETARSECEVNNLTRAMLGQSSRGPCSELSVGTVEITGYFLVGGGVLALIAGIVVALIGSGSSRATKSLETPNPLPPSDAATSVQPPSRKRLESLLELRESDLISEEEYQERRMQVLSET
ncbi:SHOCT domain-containing protein [Nesterenkonia natronophila]|uniref:SHOCT domain-containing protein n=2 Tax=Nesterenkonia natronophila TaxID=2174932 RepID=A0A3A4F673_9MICC|nr:SHOCT domain-containing protein [Nesterenkonia natronophila]